MCLAHVSHPGEREPNCGSPVLWCLVTRVLGCQPWLQQSWFSSCQVLANKSRLWVEEEVWRMEIYLSLGVLALGMLSLLAVTSLPSIANSLNWKEFSFVQVKQIPLESQLQLGPGH